jgi:hypothetical protein
VWRAAAKLPPAWIKPRRASERIDYVHSLVQAVRHSADQSARVIVAVALAIGAAGFTAWTAYGAPERLPAPTVVPDLSSAPPPSPPPPPARCFHPGNCALE